MAYERQKGTGSSYRAPAFRDIEVFHETMTFVSTMKRSFWRQMQEVGWASLLEKIGNQAPEQLARVKQAILEDLQRYKRRMASTLTRW